MQKTALLAALSLALPALSPAQDGVETASVTLTADLSGQNEVPPVDTNHTGTFEIRMDFDVDTTNDGDFDDIGDAVQEGFDDFIGLFGIGDDDDDNNNNGRFTVDRDDISKVTVYLSGDFDRTGAAGSQTITGMHIHDGPADENGPVVVNFQVMDVMAGPGAMRIDRTVMLMTDEEIDTALEIAQNPGDFYVNLHTTDNPSGEIRAQLRRSESDLNRGLRRDVRRLTMMLNQVIPIIMDLNSQERLDQLNRIDENVAAIGRRNGLNTMSEEVVGSAN